MNHQVNTPGPSGNVPPATPIPIDVEPIRRDDAIHEETRGDRLAVRIARVVKRRTAGSVLNLRVEVRRDGVFLDGECNTFYTKQLAQQAAMDLADEKPLLNRIEVR
ncbi:MAG TPA: BON domain-containing protein [Pirellulales bacterium]|nr:BON domain-containing protein [Pirellulales bacterium]